MQFSVQSKTLYIIKNSISKVNHIILLFVSAEEDI